MNVLLLTAHSIAEYDDLRMLHDLGYPVLSIGAYLDPAHPLDDKRPALPEVPAAPAELVAQIGDQMAAKSYLPDSVIEWADVVIVHHFPLIAPEGRPGWITGNWDRLRGKRVIWRTCGQSNHLVEYAMRPYRSEGLEIVRYSPLERNLPSFVGEDALIRFGKYVDDYGPWIGEETVVGNVTQNILGRGDACGYPFWTAATAGLPVSPAGPGSEKIGGRGSLAYADMLDYLRHVRCYLYTGTQPASYTLGLIEAMLTGVPVVSMGRRWFNLLPYGPALFEAPHIVGMVQNQPGEFDDPAAVHRLLEQLLRTNLAEEISPNQRDRARDLFDVKVVGEQWRAWLDRREAVQGLVEPPMELVPQAAMAQ